MIRFIDLRGQISQHDQYPCFAWWDTVIDRFIIINNTQAWWSWGEFEDDYKKHYEILNGIDRYKNLIPKDYFKRL